MMTAHQPRKRFGQHFLIDHHVLKNMVDALALQPTDHVIEIGPGLGALTDYLLPYLNHLDLVELDHDLIKHLHEKYDPKKITIHAADALTFSYQHIGNHLRIVGNLPYNISTPLLFKLFSQIEIIRDMHFMLQKEVVLRLTATVGSEDYGRLTVMSQYFCDNEYLLTVPATSFSPPPKVESAIVRLIPKKQFSLTAEQFQLFSTIVKEAFTYRRKTVGNSLKRLVDANTLISLGINPQLRPQNITVAEFVYISTKLGA